MKRILSFILIVAFLIKGESALAAPSEGVGKPDFHWSGEGSIPETPEGGQSLPDPEASSEYEFRSAVMLLGSSFANLSAVTYYLPAVSWNSHAVGEIPTPPPEC